MLQSFKGGIMGKECRAVVFRDSDKPLTIENVHIASPNKNEVMVKIAACGVCHSDMSVVNGTLPFPPPMVLGHEASGVIVQVGEGVNDLAPGDHVVVSWTANCGRCNYCRVGRQELCDENGNQMMALRNGAFPISDLFGNPVGSFLGVGVMAEYATMHRDSAIKIDKGIGLEAAAIIGCAVMTGVGAVINTAKIEVGSTVAIFGAGGIGISAIQGAVLSGALKIIAVDVVQDHLDLALKFGATHKVNPHYDGDPIAKIHEITNGGADYAFECIGLPITIAQTYESIRKGGTAVVVGVTKMTDSVALPSATFPLLEKTLKGSLYGSARPQVDFPKLLGLYQRGLLQLDEMITNRYSIEQANNAFFDLTAGKNARGIIIF